MRLLILFYAFLYQAFFAQGVEEIVATPEEIARREPDGDHILQEESRLPPVLIPPDGEVTAAAVRRAEALRYPKRIPDKFSELMEETDINEIRRIIVPPLSVQENTINREGVDKNNPTVIVKVLNPNDPETRTFIKNTLQDVTNIQISSNPTVLTKPQQPVETTINAQLPSNREIKFNTKSERIDIESSLKTSNVQPIINNSKQSVQKVVGSYESDSDKSTISSSKTESLTDIQIKELHTDDKHNDSKERKVIISNPVIKDPNDEENYNTESTTVISDKTFSFENQPIIVQDILIPGEITQPSLDLETPILKPSLDLEAPWEDIEQSTEVTVKRNNGKLETTTVLPVTLLNSVNKGSNTQKDAEITTQKPTTQTQGEQKINVVNRNNADKEVLIISSVQTKDNRGVVNSQASIKPVKPEQVTPVENIQKTLKDVTPLVRQPSADLELPKLDEESEPQEEIKDQIKGDKNGNVVETSSETTLSSLEKKESQHLQITPIVKQPSVELELPNLDQENEPHEEIKTTLKQDQIGDVVESSSEAAILFLEKKETEILKITPVVKQPSVELELPNLDQERKQHEEIKTLIKQDEIGNVVETGSKATVLLLEKKENENIDLKKNRNDQRQLQSEVRNSFDLGTNKSIQRETSRDKISNDISKKLQTINNNQRQVSQDSSLVDDLKVTEENIQNKEINIDSTHVTSEIPNVKRILSPDAISTPTQTQKSIYNVQTTTSNQRQAILGNDINKNIVYTSDNANSQNSEKDRAEALDYIKYHPLCEQVLKYMELTRPQLLFQIYISMAPFLDGISKALHTEPGYAQSYTNYYPHETRQFIPQENPRISRQNHESEIGSHPQHKKRCVKSVQQRNNLDLENIMPIAEALYRRQNVLEEHGLGAARR